MWTMTSPEHLTYLDALLDRYLKEAAVLAKAQDPHLDLAEARLRAARHTALLLQGAKDPEFDGKIIEIGREVRGSDESPDRPWSRLAYALELKRPESAQQLIAAGRRDRLQKAVVRVQGRTAEPKKRNLPGVGVTEAAERLGVTRATVYRRAERGELQYDIIEGIWRITSALPESRSASTTAATGQGQGDKGDVQP